MKTKLIFAVVCFILTTTMLCVAGCSESKQQEVSQTHAESTSDSESTTLVNRLQSFNNALIGAVTPETGWSKFWRHFTQVCHYLFIITIGISLGLFCGKGLVAFFTKSKIILRAGAAIGILIIGGTSVFYAIDTDWQKDERKPTPFNTTVQLYINQSVAECIAEEEVMQMISKSDIHVPFFASHPQYNRIGAIYNIGLQKRGVPTFVIGRPCKAVMLEYPDFVKSKAQHPNQPQSTPDALSPSAAKCLTLFQELYATYPKSLNDIDHIVQYYAEQIDASTAIAPHDKQIILSVLSIAAYSPRF